MVHPVDGFSIFDDKGEVKLLVDFLILANIGSLHLRTPPKYPKHRPLSI